MTLNEFLQSKLSEFDKEFKDDGLGGDFNNWSYVQERIKPFLSTALKEIVEERDKEIKDLIISADSLLSFLHHRGYINYQKKDCPNQMDVNKIIGELRRLSDQITSRHNKFKE